MYLEKSRKYCEYAELTHFIPTQANKVEQIEMVYQVLVKSVGRHGGKHKRQISIRSLP